MRASSLRRSQGAEWFQICDSRNKSLAMTMPFKVVKMLVNFNDRNHNFLPDDSKVSIEQLTQMAEDSQALYDKELENWSPTRQVDYVNNSKSW